MCVAMLDEISRAICDELGALALFGQDGREREDARSVFASVAVSAGAGVGDVAHVLGCSLAAVSHMKSAADLSLRLHGVCMSVQARLGRLPGAIAPEKLCNDDWTAIEQVLGRCLVDDERVLVRRRYSTDMALRHLEPGFAASMIFGGIRSTDGRPLEIVAKAVDNGSGGCAAALSVGLGGMTKG